MREPLKKFIVGKAYRVLPIEVLQTLKGAGILDECVDTNKTNQTIELECAHQVFVIDTMQELCGQVFTAQNSMYNIMETTYKNIFTIVPWMCEECKKPVQDSLSQNLESKVPWHPGTIIVVGTGTWVVCHNEEYNVWNLVDITRGLMLPYTSNSIEELYATYHSDADTLYANLQHYKTHIS